MGKNGRKNLKRGVEDNNLVIQDGQSIMQVTDLRGGNLIGVKDAKGKESLALVPAKFNKSMWMKPGGFVVVDDSGREEALEAGDKVTCIVSQVLFHEQVRRLQKCSVWPDAFKPETKDSHATMLPSPAVEQSEETNTSDDDDEDGLPPLEANMNRVRPFDLHATSYSDSNTDSENDD